MITILHGIKAAPPISPTDDAIIGNQAFTYGGCNICSGLNYNEATNTFLNSLRKKEV